MFYLEPCHDHGQEGFWDGNSDIHHSAEPGNVPTADSAGLPDLLPYTTGLPLQHPPITTQATQLLPGQTWTDTVTEAPIPAATEAPYEFLLSLLPAAGSLLPSQESSSVLFVGLCGLEAKTTSKVLITPYCSANVTFSGLPSGLSIRTIFKAIGECCGPSADTIREFLNKYSLSRIEVATSGTPRAANSPSYDDVFAGYRPIGSLVCWI